MNKTIIFILNVGRSGSNTLAKEYNLLHEPDGAYPKIKNVHERIKGKLIYGETSHFWKNQISDLQKEFPDAKYYHLVRDPKKVVKSFQRRRHYSSKAKMPYHTENLPPFELSMNRFEKLCWYYRYWNEVIEKHIYTRIRLEDLNLNNHVNKGQPAKPWTNEEIESFNRICGNIRMRYGYKENI